MSTRKIMVISLLLHLLVLVLAIGAIIAGSKYAIGFLIGYLAGGTHTLSKFVFVADIQKSFKTWKRKKQ